MHRYKRIRKLVGRAARWTLGEEIRSCRGGVSDLRVTQLETRRVLNGDGVASELVVDAGADANDGQSDSFHLSVDGDQVQLSVNGRIVQSGHRDQVQSIRINGSSDNDTIVADVSGGWLDGIDLSINGGGGEDVLRIVGDQPWQVATHQYNGDGGGALTLSSSAHTAQLQYQGIEQVRQEVSADRVTFQIDAGDDALTLQDAAGEGSSRLTFGGASENADTSLQAIDFWNPTEQLLIDTTAGDDADVDSLVVLGWDDNFEADVVLQSDFDDSIGFAGNVSLGGRDLTVGGGDLQIASTVTSYQATIDFAAAGTMTVTESGVILNDGGSVLLSGSAIDLDGMIRAAGGDVILDSGNDGTTIIRGLIDVSDAGEGGTGGDVQVLGMNVGLFGQARIDASGDVGGGTVLIGGDYQGANAEVRNAQRAFIGEAAVIRADAIRDGDGGRVIVWADDWTQFRGTISARGGALDGDGGLIETSGKVTLQVTGGSADASAANGAAGTWLLDPSNVTINDSGTDFTPSGGNPNTFSTTVNNAEIDAATIAAALTDGTHVIVQTNSARAQAGNITVSTAITKTIAGDATLTLSAEGRIRVNAAISSTSGMLNVILDADTDGNGTGDVEVFAAITTNGGTFTSNGEDFDNTAAITTDGGLVTITHTDTVTIDAALDAGAGNVGITSTGDDVEGGGLITANTLTVNADEGIGTGTALVTAVTSLILTTDGDGSDGNINVNETDGAALTITTNTTATTDDQTITITTDTGDPMTSGNLTIAGAVGDVADTIVLNADGNVDGDGGTIHASSLTVNAGGGIGIGTALATNATTMVLTTAGSGTAGNVTVNEASGAALTVTTNTTATEDAQAITITTDTGDPMTTGDLTIAGTVGDTADTIVLDADGDVDGAGGTINAAGLTVVAGEGIGIGTALSTNASILNLTSAGAGAVGNITVNEANGASLTVTTNTTATEDAQTIAITSTTGDLTIAGSVSDTADTVGLTATAGNVNGGGGTVNALGLTVDAGGGIGIGVGAALATNAGTLVLTSAGAGAAGNITVTESDGAGLTIATNTTATEDDQNIAITSTTGDLTIAGSVADTADTVSLNATSGNVNGGGGTVNAASLTVVAGEGIGIGTALSANATTYHLTSSGANAAGNISLTDTGSLNTSQISTLATAATAQTITLAAGGGDLTVNSALTLGTDDFMLTATGDVIVSTAIAKSVAGTSTLTLSAEGSVTVDAAITASTGVLNVVFDADSETDGTGDVDLNVGVTTNGGTFTSGGVGFDNTGGSVTTGGGLVSVSHAGTVTVGGAVNAGTGDTDITSTAGDIEGGGTITAGGLTLDAAGGIGLLTAVTADATSYTLSSNGLGALGDIALIDTGALSTSQIASLTTNGAGQTVALSAAGGDLTVNADIGVASDNLALIAAGNVVGGAGTATAAVLTINAAGGIGIGSAVSANATTYHLVTDGAGTLGNIALVDAGSLNTSQISTLTTAASTQVISLSAAAGDLTVNSSLPLDTDDFTLAASDDVIVNTAIAKSVAGTSTLTLSAEDSVIVNASITATTGLLNVVVDADSDTDGSGDVDINAAISTNGGTFTSGGEAFDNTGGSITTGGVSVTINHAGAVTVGGALDAGVGNVGISSAGSDIEGGGTITSNVLTLNAAGGIGIGAAVVADATTYQLTTAGVGTLGNIFLTDTGALSTSQIGTLVTNGDGQTVSLSAGGGDLTVNAAIGDALDDLILNASGDVVGTAAIATAATLTVSAGGGIGIGAGNELRTAADTIALTSSGANAAGDITVIESDGASFSATTAGATAQTVDLTVQLGDFATSAGIGDSLDAIRLEATVGNINGGPGAVTASALTLVAGGGIGIASTVSADAAVYHLSTGGVGTLGNITLADTGALSTSQIGTLSTNGAGQVVDLGAAGNLTVDSLIGNSSDDLVLRAGADILDGGGTATASGLTLNAGLGIGIGTAVSVNASTYQLVSAGADSAGDIHIAETGTLATSQIVSVGTAATTQTVEFSAAGDLTVDAAIGSAGDNLTFNSTSNVVGGAVATAATLTVNAAGGIGVGVALNTAADSLVLDSAGVGTLGNITVVEADGAGLTISTAASAQTIDVTMTTGNITTDSAIGDGLDSIRLEATAGDINGGAGNITANVLTLVAGEGIGIVTPISADASVYHLTSGGAGTEGNVRLSDSGALNTSQILTLSTPGTGQTVELTAALGNLTVDSAIGDAANDLTLNASGDVLGNALITGGTLTVNAGGGIGIGVGMELQTAVDDLVLSSSGLNALGDITVVESNGASLSVSTDATVQTVSVTFLSGDLTASGGIGDGGDNVTLIASGGNIVGGGTILAGILTLDASGGIGVGTAVTANATLYHLNTSGLGTLGNITLVDTGGLNTTQIGTLSTVGSGQVIDLTATGNLTVGASIGNASDDLVLRATSGVEGGAGTATAGELTLDAGAGIGTVMAVTVDAATYRLISAGASGAGDIRISDVGALNTSQIVELSTVGAGQTVTLTASGGSLTVDAAIGEATDNLTLQALMNVDGNALATADDLVVNAGEGIGIGATLNTAAVSLDLNSSGTGVAGNINVVESDGATLAVSTDALSDQTVSITFTTGDLTAEGGIGDGSDNVSLTASDGDIVGGTEITAGILTLDASGGIGIGTAVTADATTYHLATGTTGPGGNITLIDSGALSTSQIGTLSHAGDLVDLTAALGDLTVDASLGDGTYDLNLSASNDVVGGAVVNAQTLTVVAGGGIGIGTELSTSADDLVLQSSGVAALGDITVTEADGASLAVTTNLLSSQVVDITFTTGDLTTSTSIGDAFDSVSLEATAGGIEGGGGTVNASVLTLVAGQGIGATTAVTANAGTYHLTTAGAGAIGNITLEDTGDLLTSQIATLSTVGSGQTVDLSAIGGNLTVNAAIGNGSDGLSLRASGSVNGGDVATADTLLVDAGAGIGTGTALTTTAQTVTLTSSGSGAAGNITVTETDGATISAATDSSAQTIRLTATTGDFMLGAIGDSSDNVILDAQGGNLEGIVGNAVTASSLQMTASGGIGTTTPVNSEASSYILQTSGAGVLGNISIVDADTLNTSQVTLTTDGGTAQVVSLTTSLGDLTSDGALGNAMDDLTLIASDGAIVDGGSTVTANLLTAQANDGLSLNFAATNLDAMNLVSGNVVLQSAGDVIVNRIANSVADDADNSTGSVTLDATGQTITVASTGTGIAAVDGNIDLDADVVAVESLVTTSGLGEIDINAATSLTATSSGIISNDVGSLSGWLLSAADPLAGVQVGDLLSDSQRLAQIFMFVWDPFATGVGIEIDWQEGDATTNTVRSEFLLADAFGIVSGPFSHFYDNPPDIDDPNADILVEIRVTDFADDTIRLTEGGTRVEDSSRFSTEVLLGVATALFPIAPPLPETRDTTLQVQGALGRISLPSPQRVFTVTAPQELINSIGATVQETERYYVLRIVTFGEEGEIKLMQEGQDFRLYDLDDPESKDEFELSQLPELFKRLPDNRYRLFLIDGQTERLVLDFIIRDGQPQEAQEEATFEIDGTELDPPAVVPAVDGDSSVTSERDVENVPSSEGGDSVSIDSRRDAVAQLGRTPAISSGGVLLTAGMVTAIPKRRRGASRPGAQDARPANCAKRA